MRPIPELKSAQHLLKLGRKDLSDKNVFELQKLADELDKIQDEDRHQALFRQGVIHLYLNNFSEATACFFQSNQLNPDSDIFANYLRALRNAKGADLAIEKGLDYLEKNPNNLEIFKVILSILCDYKSQKDLDVLKKFITYHVDHINHKPYVDLLKDIQERYNFIKQIGLNGDLYNIIISNLDIELHKLFINIDIRSEYSFNKDYIRLKLINLPDYHDISLLNRNFDQAIQREIEKGNLDFDDYIDSLDKLVVGFRANPDAEAA